MDIKFRKTVLDDDAEMYQASKDAVTKEDIKKLSGKQKLAYFQDYYLKICVVVILCVVAAVYFLYTSVINPSREVFSVIFLNGCYVEDTEGLSGLLEEKIGMERKKDYVGVEYFNLEDYQMNMVFITRISAGSADIVICSPDDFTEQAKNGMFLDLRECLPEETYESFGDRIVMGKTAETDLQGNVISYSEEIPFGIELPDSGVCGEYVESSQTPVLCVSASCKDIDKALKVIECFAEDSAVSNS